MFTRQLRTNGHYGQARNHPARRATTTFTTSASLATPLLRYAPGSGSGNEVADTALEMIPPRLRGRLVWRGVAVPDEVVLHPERSTIPLPRRERVSYAPSLVALLAASSNMPFMQAWI